MNWSRVVRQRQLKWQSVGDSVRNHSKLAMKVLTSMGRRVTVGKLNGTRVSNGVGADGSLSAGMVFHWNLLSATIGRLPVSVVSSAAVIVSPALLNTLLRSTVTGCASVGCSPASYR